MRRLIISSCIFCLAGCQPDRIIEEKGPNAPKSHAQLSGSNETTIAEHKKTLQALFEKLSEAKENPKQTEKQVIVTQSDSTQAQKEQKAIVSLAGPQEPFHRDSLQHYFFSALTSPSTANAHDVKAYPQKENTQTALTYQQKTFSIETIEDCETNSNNCVVRESVLISTTDDTTNTTLPLPNGYRHQLLYLDFDLWLLGTSTQDEKLTHILTVSNIEADKPLVSPPIKLSGELLEWYKDDQTLYLLLNFSPDIDGIAFPIDSESKAQENQSILSELDEHAFSPLIKHARFNLNCYALRMKQGHAHPSSTLLVAIDTWSSVMTQMCFTPSISAGEFDNHSFYFGTPVGKYKEKPDYLYKVILDNLNLTLQPNI